MYNVHDYINYHTNLSRDNNDKKQFFCDDYINDIASYGMFLLILRMIVGIFKH